MALEKWQVFLLIISVSGAGSLLLFAPLEWLVMRRLDRVGLGSVVRVVTAVAFLVLAFLVLVNSTFPAQPIIAGVQLALSSTAGALIASAVIQSRKHRSVV